MSQEVSKWIVGRGPPCAKSGLFKSQLVSQVWEPPKNEGLGPDAWTPPGTWNNKFVLVVRWNYHVSNGCQVKQPIFYVMIWIIQLSCLVYHRHACFRCHLSFFGGKMFIFCIYILYVCRKVFAHDYHSEVFMQITCLQPQLVRLPLNCQAKWRKIRKSIRSIRNLAVPPNASHETTGRWHGGGHQA